MHEILVQLLGQLTQEFNARAGHPSQDVTKVRIRRVEHALRLLHSGHPYGVCTVCGEVIDPRRLAIIPEATRCVVCAA